MLFDIYVLAGVAIAVLAVLVLLLYKTITRPYKPSPPFTQDRAREHLSNSGNDGLPVSVPGDTLISDETPSAFARLIRERRDLNTAAEELAEEVGKLEAGLGILKTEVEVLREENRQLSNSTKELGAENASLQEKNEAYFARQGDVDNIKELYRTQQGQLKTLIDNSDAAKLLLTRIVHYSIEGEEESDAVRGRLALLRELESATREYESSFDIAVERSNDLMTEIERSNAGRQVEVFKQLIQNRRLDSLAAIPEILEDIRTKIEHTNRPINPTVLSDISEYRQFLLSTHPPNVRTVPVSLTDLLERLCKDAQVGEMDVLEAIVDEILRALTGLYGKP